MQPEKLIKRTGNFVNLVSKALNNASNGEPAYIKARHEAEDADKIYRVAVRKLDRQRLGLEERLEDTLKTLQRWETERLRAVKTGMSTLSASRSSDEEIYPTLVLLQYQGTLANLPKSLEPSIERSATLVASFQPESDLTALIERYRTGPFRPDPQVYESVSHDECDVVFGIDLRKWAEGGWHALTSGEEKKEIIPPVVTALLGGLTEAYGRLPNDAGTYRVFISALDPDWLFVQKSGSHGFMKFLCRRCTTFVRQSMLSLLSSRFQWSWSPSTMRRSLRVLSSYGYWSSTHRWRSMRAGKICESCTRPWVRRARRKGRNPKKSIFRTWARRCRGYLEYICMCLMPL